MANNVINALFGSGGSGDSSLNAFDRTIADNSIYNQIAEPIANTKLDPSGGGYVFNRWTPNQIAATTLGQAFLTSALKALGRRDQTEQINKVASILPALSKNPMAVSTPEGVDPEAFAALKVAKLNDAFEEEKKAQEQKDAMNNQIKAHFLTSYGADYNPDTGEVKFNPSATSVIADLITKKKGATDEKIKSSPQAVKISQSLGARLAAIAALNHNDEQIKDLEGWDNYLGGAYRWFDTKLNPNSKVAQYQNNLPFLADPLTKGLSGSSRQGILEKTLNALNPDFGLSKESMLNSSAEARQAMIDLASKELDSLKQIGYPLNDIEDWQQKLKDASIGTLVDKNQTNKNIQQEPTSSDNGIDAIEPRIRTMMDQDIKQLNAQNATKEEIMSIIGHKYSEYLK